ncbi:O-mycaminosyltylonolide 6-deoxyallosyltransferase-like [Oppia nitens]|uniref:O-mycaminosyltylonolide 6-deoxyallosyltransferase-like n=1 Tax=Oppia nitens TaxID=1686743 RepID=UPI0023DA0833|nr:O-mycaminosyltylonolide 6-deoxyallosyltransferase-like [Oppia nitens]
MRVLFVPIAGTGHVNAAIGMAQVLLSSGHECWFDIGADWRDKLRPYGIRMVGSDTTETEDRDDKTDDKDKQNTEKQYLKSHALSMKEKGILGSESTPLEKALLQLEDCDKMFAFQQQQDLHVNQVIRDLRPDVIVCDQFLSLPSVTKSGIPWVLVCSANPLTSIHHECTPPWFSGLPTNGPKEDWQSYRKALMTGSRKLKKLFDDNELANGLPPLPEMAFINDSKYLNIYGYPLELDYLDLRPLPDNWYRFDNLMRYDSKPSTKLFEIPDQLRDKPGKLIYFSLGSMGGADVDNMKRLIAILAKSGHRFIVSKGLLGDDYDLPVDNMWGQPSVPQLEILPLVDLVITHGGNNTISETIYFGKPMIVMPLFADQYDNAQRVHEKGFGIRLDAYKCSEEELLSSIECLLNNNLLTEKLSKISQRIQSEKSIEKLPQLLLELVHKC